MKKTFAVKKSELLSRRMVKKKKENNINIKLI